MPGPIESYALLSDTESCALVGADGSIDWLTFPRFDSAACFAALLGAEQHGRWLVAPAGPVVEVSRRYRPGTLVLETTSTTPDGVVEVVDCMPVRSDHRLDLVRVVRGVSGEVPVRVELVPRFDYGSLLPLVRPVPGGVQVIAGPDCLTLGSDVPLVVDRAGGVISAEVTVRAGESVAFDMAWNPSHLPSPQPLDAHAAVADTTRWWREWSDRCTTFPHHDEPIRSSLVVLKGLTYAPTGGIVAAATTSLPEAVGGSRNWDYRYCWLRDATFTLTSLVDAGFTEEATAWRDWLVRAVAGRPEDAQIMYGPAGEHRLTELVLDWLPGYEGSAPVRIGNGAHGQLQLDVYGEVLDTFAQAELDSGGPAAWELGVALADAAADRWREPDDGLWEVRGGRRHFTHSKVMAWVALDRAIRIAGRVDPGGTAGAPLERWRATCQEIKAEVLTRGVDERGVLVQELGGTALDASLLVVPLVGFLPPDDPRVVATVEAVRRELGHDGFIRRYDTTVVDDGIGEPEGTFLLCTLWLAEVLALQGRIDEAEEVFQRVLDVRNDVGLLSEMYDPTGGRQLGNFPQAFSHTGVVSAGMLLSRCLAGEPPTARRA
jgi:GH15 family glucan-1,4-alpha-glucosidase